MVTHTNTLRKCRHLFCFPSHTCGIAIRQGSCILEIWFFRECIGASPVAGPFLPRVLMATWPWMIGKIDKRLVNGTTYIETRTMRKDYSMVMGQNLSFGFAFFALQLLLPKTACISIRGPMPLPLSLRGSHWGDDILFDQLTGAMEFETGFETPILNLTTRLTPKCKVG